MNEPLLSVRNLHISYLINDDVVEAVRGVDFTVAAGSVLGIIGGSGAGKSTIALALAGLCDSARTTVTGDICIDGRNVLTMTDEQQNKLRGGTLGMVFQDSRSALDPTMKVVNQVAEAIRLHHKAGRSEAHAEAIKRLRDVGISDELLQHAPYPHQLSSGLCQRAMIAIALAGNPKLLVADEPTGSLDLTRQAQIINLIKERVTAAALGMVFITHDLGLANVVADHLLVMHEGNQVEFGPRPSIIESPRHEYTVSLLTAWRNGFLYSKESNAVT